MIPVRCILLHACICLAASAVWMRPVLARTWVVERDGSGDFTIIQDAVDVAASGDTIQIGPGRFDEKHYVTSPGWSDSVRVHVTQHELTFIGSGPATIIGQVNLWEPEQGLHKGIATGDLWGNSILRVENLRFENMRDAIYTSYEGAGEDLVEIRNCSFYFNNYAIILYGDGGGVRIADCIFTYMAGVGLHIYGGWQRELVITGCTFQLLDSYLWGQDFLGLVGVKNALIEECDFLEGTSGASVTYGGQTTFRGCLFDGQTNVALYPSANSIVAVDSCTFRNQAVAMSSGTGDNQIAITNSVIESVADCSFLILDVGDFTVTHCDLAHGQRGVVWVMDNVPCTTIGYLDMANNYWGTDNVFELTSWIHDDTDSEDACYHVSFNPFLPQSTPTQKESLGGVKALFR